MAQETNKLGNRFSRGGHEIEVVVEAEALEKQHKRAQVTLKQPAGKTKGFDGWDRVLFHIDEAMSWETVRNLDQMPPLLLIIRNLCSQGKAPREVMENIEDVNDILKEVLHEYHK